jgi:nucleoside-diphosphate-sugar epimerase
MEVILVTGANRGIGLALTRVLLASQNIVIAGCRKPDQATELSQLALSYPETLDLIQCDLYSENQLAAAAETSVKRRQKVDVIVNNAAILPEAGNESILNIDLDLLGRAFNTNVLGTARVIRAFYPLFAQSERPRIVNFSSGLGSISTREGHDHYAYSASAEEDLHKRSQGRQRFRNPFFSYRENRCPNHRKVRLPLALTPTLLKAVRGLRQRRAYYRCCIPALAGFVSQRSIAPDGSVSIH